MHTDAYNYVKQQVEKYGPFKRVLEIGGRDINGSVKDLFVGADYLSIDLYPGPGVDIVGDAAELEFSSKFDCIVCCEVLEHTFRAQAIINKAFDNLVKGGTLIITTACSPRMPHSALDGGPLQAMEYYSNIEEPTLNQWLVKASFNKSLIERNYLGESGGDIYATAWKL